MNPENPKKILQSLLNADEETYRTFESLKEEYKYLLEQYQSAEKLNGDLQEELKNIIHPESPRRSALLWQIEQANKNAANWFDRLHEFKSRHPDIK